MRLSLTFASILAVFLLHTAAFAQSSVSDSIVAQLQNDGYSVTEVRRSWLGRIVITANKGENLREIVLNRTSGEILRDLTFPTKRNSEAGPATSIGKQGNDPRPQNSENPGEPGGPGPGGGGHGGKG